MSQGKLQTSGFPAADRRRNWPWLLVVFGLLGLIMPGLVGAQPAPAKDYEIKLQARSFTPIPGIEPAYKDSLAARLRAGESRHVYLQLNKQLSAGERARLEEQGVKLLSYIGSYTWHATVSNSRALNFAVPDSVRAIPVLETVRWIGEIKPEDRVNPKVLSEGVAPYSRETGDTVYILVSLHKDISLDEGKSAVERAGGRVIGEIGIINTLQIAGPASIVNQLMRIDGIKWINQLPPKGEDDNDELRGAINVDVLQSAPYNLDGTNVTVGQWEANNADNSHDDFGTRVTVGDPPASISSHATHVCGIVLGDGSRSLIEGGIANQWRGVATNAECVTFRAHLLAGALDVATLETHYNTALAAPHNIAISTNSWGTDHYHTGGDYDIGCELYDQIVCGALGRPIPIVASAGNQGPFMSATDWGTVRIPNSAKNTIEVGAVFSDRDEITWFSSTGPTDDGRLKPDVVAPGDQADDDPANPVLSGDEIMSTVSTDTYDDKAGTSMSTPAVSGVIALMLQQYRIDYWGDVNSLEVPYPSTYKAILCHTATDMLEDPQYHAGVNFAGPDYIYGYGQVNAQAAVDAILDHRFREGVIGSPTDYDLYTINVAAGDDELKVTLAWDDSAGTIGSADLLENDLDLILISPDGSTYHTPWELDPANPATPAVRNTYASEAAAVAGRDDVNVTEQVLVDNPASGDWTVKVKAADLPYSHQKYSIIAGDQSTDILLGQVEVVQVLDRSGSMLGAAESGSTDRKIDVLQVAAKLVIDMVEENQGHKMGLIKYRHDVIPMPSVTLDHEVTAAYKTTLHTRIDEIDDDVEWAHMTSIGDGLAEALVQFDNHGDVANRQVIILMTDGKGNSESGVDDVWTTAKWDDNTAIIYTLGLGHNGGICSDTLSWLADSTGGDYRETADPLEFGKFFIEALASAVDWSVVTDPREQLSPGETETSPVVITEYDNIAVFTAYWSEIDDAIGLYIVTPGGDTVGTEDPDIHYYESDHYILYRISQTGADWSGEWKMVVVSKSQQTVDYSTSSVVESSLELEAGFDASYNMTGDQVRIWAELVATPVIPLPPPKPDIIAYGNVPLEGVGNVLHDNPVDIALLNPIDSLADYDPMRLKLDYLMRESREDILPRGPADLKLYDDGAHNDGAANDGLYANTFTQTEKQGTYTFRFVASNIPTVSGLTTTREWTKTFFNEVDATPGFSQFDIRASRFTADGATYRLIVTPQDRFQNFLGPGHHVTAAVAQGSAVTLVDNVDGTYSNDIFMTKAQVDAGTNVDVMLDNRSFTSVSPPPPSFTKWGVSFHTGAAIPTGNMANYYDPGINVMFDFGYWFNPNLTLMGFFGYNDFPADSVGWDDNYIINISVNARYYQPYRLLPMPPWSYYIGGGLGYYLPDIGDNEFGFNIGAGLNYEVNRMITLEVGADYHQTFNDDIKFIHTHGGVIVKF
jgi:opacity protein-like surface antigen